MAAFPAAGALGVSAGAGQNELTWNWPNLPEDIEGFLIQRSTNGQNFITYATLLGTEWKGFTDDGDADPDPGGPGLPPGTRFHYRARAFGGIYHGTSYTPKVGATTVMPAPENVQASAISPTQVRLTWDDVTDNEVRFEIQVMDGSGNPITVITNVPPNPSGTGEYIVADLQPNSTYTFSMRSWGPGGRESAWTLPTSPVPTPPTQPLAAPTNLTAVLLPGGMIGLSWTDNSNNEEGFAIEGATGSGQFEEIDRTAPGETSHVVADPEAATAYRFRIRGFNTSGVSNYTSEQAITTLPVPELTATGLSSETIRLAWSAPSGASGFQIERTDSSGDITTYDVPATPMTWDDNSVVDGRSYTYTIRFKSGTVTSRHSAEAHATTALKGPVQLNGVVDPSDPTKINLNWVDLTNSEDAQEIEYREDLGEYELLEVLDANIDSYTIGDIVAGKTYQVRVRAKNTDAGYSEWTECTVETTLPAPTNLVADEVSDREVNLTWVDNALTEVNYQIQYQVSGSGFVHRISDVPANAQGYTFTNLAPSTTYTFYVRAMMDPFGLGGSEVSNPATVTTDAAGSPLPPQPGPYMVYIGTMTSPPGSTIHSYVSGELELFPHDPIIADTPEDAVRESGVIDGSVTIRVWGSDVTLTWDEGYDVYYDYDPDPTHVTRGPLKWDPQQCAYVGVIGLEDDSDGDYDDWVWPVWVVPDCIKPQVALFTDDSDGSEDTDPPGSSGPTNPTKFTVHRLDPTPFGELTVDFHSLAGTAELGDEADYELFVKHESGSEQPVTPDAQRRFSVTFLDQETSLELIVRPVDNEVPQVTRSVFGMLAAHSAYTVLSFLTAPMLVKDNELVPNLRVDSNNSGFTGIDDDRIEERPGTSGLVVSVNGNDSDGNGLPDLNEPGPLQNPDLDLLEMRLDVPQQAGAQGIVRLAVQQSDQRVKVWLDRRKGGGGPLLGGGLVAKDWALGQQPDTVWIEGLKPSLVHGDVLFSLAFIPAPNPIHPNPRSHVDWVRVSVARSDPVIIGFYGADTWIGGPNWGHQLLTGIGNNLLGLGFDQKTYWSREYPKAFKELLAKLDYNKDGKYEPGKGDAKRDIRIYGHSWGGLSAILLSQRIEKANSKFIDDSVDILATIDPVYFGRTGKNYAGGVPGNVRYFWNRYASKTKRQAAVRIPLPIPGVWEIYPHGAHVPSQAQNNPPNADQIDRNPTGIEPMSPTDTRIINHFLIIELEEVRLLNLLTKNGGPI